jgi:protease-4
MNESSSQPNSVRDAPWERDLIGKIAMAALVEQRRARRWSIFFKLLFLFYLLITTWLFYSALNWDGGVVGGGRHTAVVSVDGLIIDGADASAGNIVTALRAAFKDEDTAGVIVRINSPGGSPVQAGQVYDEMRRLREKYPKIPLYAVASDLCASGGYYIAAAAQEIYADKASIIGSIGVRADGFGFVEAMQKLGIERRLYTAGENKALLDPFSPQQPQDIQHFQGLLSDVHQQFIKAVQQGRDERLKDNPQLFSGLVWTGEQSVELGLIDGLGSVRYVAEELIGAERLVDYTPRSSWLERVLVRFGTSFGSALSQTVMYLR